MCRITGYFYSCGCSCDPESIDKDHDYVFCEGAITEAKCLPMGFEISEHCSEWGRLIKINKRCLMHSVAMAKFCQAASLASRCRKSGCDMEMHRRVASYSSVIMYDIFFQGGATHEQMVAVDAIVKLHMGSLSPKPAKDIRHSIADRVELLDDSGMIEWALEKLVQVQKSNTTNEQVLQDMHRIVQTNGSQLRAIGKLAWLGTNAVVAHRLPQV